MKRYAKFGFAAPFRFRVILEKPQGGGGQNDPPTRAKVNMGTGQVTKLTWPQVTNIKIQDTQIARTIDLINFYKFKNTGFITVAVAGCQSC